MSHAASLGWRARVDVLENGQQNMLEPVIRMW